ncbi:glycosyl transferase family protein [Reinekea marina]|uniref:Glycosyl transferase family protein n=2 Tax=Reinekea marina TaxID=1310421 RepID=A0ABV7WNG2_9GAMM
MSDSAMTLPGIIRILGRGKTGSRDLTFEEAHFAMSAILDGKMEDLQLGAFLMLLRVKEETSSEIAGMVQACHDAISIRDTVQVDVTWPAYAGKKRQPSWYLLAAKLLAQNGVSVLMHGAGHHTANRQYAQQVCQLLNLPCATLIESASNLIQEHNFCYIPLEAMNPTLSRLIDLKHTLGLRSCANTLVRHLTPFKTNLTLQAMFHPAYQSLHHEVAEKLSQNNNIVLKGDGGEFEVRPDSETRIAIQGYHPLDNDFVPKSLKRRSVRPDAPTFTALIELWNDDSSNAYGLQATVDTAAIILSKLQSLPYVDAQKQTHIWWKNRY